MNVQQKLQPPDETLHSAYALAFGEIEGATKDAENPAFKQGGKAIKYANLTSVIDAIRPALFKHHLFFTQHPIPSDGGVSLETMLHHASGESMSLGTLFVPANKHDAQGYGSALTYARRYALQTAFGVPTEDDDGNAAVKAGPAKFVAEPEPAPAARENWGGRYPNKSKLWAACRAHQSELNRLGVEATFDDLEAFTTSPEYSDFVTQANAHFSWMLDGPAPDAMPEFVPTFTIEAKARDLIALRGNISAEAA